MDEISLQKIQVEINALRSRAGNIKRGDLVSLAERLGREFSRRGKEPTFVQRQLPNRYPLSIPNHIKIAKFTALGILDTLEDDVEAWREWLCSKKQG